MSVLRGVTVGGLVPGSCCGGEALLPTALLHLIVSVVPPLSSLVVWTGFQEQLMR